MAPALCTSSDALCTKSPWVTELAGSFVNSWMAVQKSDMVP